MLRYATFIVALLLLVSCGKQWSHNTKNEQDFYRDSANCMAMSKGGGGANPQIQQSSGVGFAGGFTNGYNMGTAIRSRREADQIYEYCMRGLGYTAE